MIPLILKNKVLHSIKIAGILYISIYIQACSFSEEEIQGPDSLRKGRQAMQLDRHQLVNVQLYWKIPAESVEGFILRVKSDKYVKDTVYKVEIKDLEKLDHEQHGFVYGYTLRNVNRHEPLFVSVQSYKGEKISSAAEVYTIYVQH